MNGEGRADLAPDRIPADRRLVDELYGHGLISREARDGALELLYPHKSWGLWVSRLLLSVGTGLVLAGVVYFFAFNWAKLPVAAKLGLIETALFGCAAAAFACGLDRLSGKTLLLSASVLVGVFSAVFGQIYQTGADAYSLFLAWAILIAGWVLLSDFAALWAVWLTVCNVFLALYWTQAVLPPAEQEALIYPILAAFNLIFLGLREMLAARGAAWLSERWTRLVLVVPVLVLLLIPATLCFAAPAKADQGLWTGAMAAVAVHAGLFFLYRYAVPDVWALTAVFLSGCVMAEVIGFRFLYNLFPWSEAVSLLLSGLMSIAVFTLAVSTLRHLVRDMEASDAR